jgi:beta-lactamase regulating signal transducer with metallopeptidase domain
MVGEFMFGVFNTSVVTGLSIAAAGILLRGSWKRYNARCRKRIWIFMAFCFFIPFHLFHFPGAYTAEIPNVVLQEFESSSANGVGKQVMTDGSLQSTQSQTEHNQAVDTLAPQISGQKNSGMELTVADALFVVWAFMCVLFTVYYAMGYWGMRRRIRRWSSECEDGYVLQVAQEVAAECKLKRIPEVRIMKDSEVGPFTTGVWRNIIILPDDALHEKGIRFILKHEMIHCRNHDISWRLLFLTVNIIHWFNPLAWYLRRAMEQDMEIACDEEVVSKASNEKRREYSDVIMSWVERSRYRGNAVSMGYVKGGGFLKRRFDCILNGGKKKNGLLLAGSICLFALFIGCAIQLQSNGKVYANGEPEAEAQDNHTKVTKDIQIQNDEVGDNLNPYKDILDKYYQAIYEHQTNPEQFDVNNYGGLILSIVNPYWALENEQNILSMVGFAYVDLNEDGIDELALGWIDNEFWNMDEGYVFAVYTIVDGKAALAIEGWERCLYVIGKDGYLYNSGSSGADESTYTKYKFSLEKEDFLEPVEEFYSYYSYDGNEKLWEHITNPEDINVIDLLTDEDEAETMGESWMESGIEIDYTLFEDYEGGI